MYVSSPNEGGALGIGNEGIHVRSEAQGQDFHKDLGAMKTIRMAIVKSLVA
jgi:hypothetical protein